MCSDVRVLLLLSLVVCVLIRLFVWLVGGFVGFVVGWWVGWLVGWFVDVQRLCLHFICIFSGTLSSANVVDLGYQICARLSQL